MNSMKKRQATAAEAKALANPLRLRILRLCLDEALTNKELAAGADEFMLPVTQEELAGMVGASRERVNKAISAFVRLKWIEQVDRRYKITDREQLTRRAR